MSKKVTTRIKDSNKTTNSTQGKKDPRMPNRSGDRYVTAARLVDERRTFINKWYTYSYTVKNYFYVIQTVRATDKLKENLKEHRTQKRSNIPTSQYNHGYKLKMQIFGPKDSNHFVQLQFFDHSK